MNFISFIRGSIKIIFRGSKTYYAWLILLLILIVWGGLGYADQLSEGLITTNMRDSVSWAFYIGNFTFLVGVAAAAVMLVIPAYIYDWKPIKEIVIFDIPIYFIIDIFLFRQRDHYSHAFHQCRIIVIKYSIDIFLC